jgi:hypothetical protein
MRLIETVITYTYMGIAAKLFEMRNGRGLIIRYRKEPHTYIAGQVDDKPQVL